MIEGDGVPARSSTSILPYQLQILNLPAKHNFKTPMDKHTKAAHGASNNSASKPLFDDTGYYDAVLPGLECASQRPAAATPWIEGEPGRWWVRCGTKGVRRTHALMFCSKAVKTGKGAEAYHQLLCEARFLNARRDGCGAEPALIEHQITPGHLP